MSILTAFDYIPERSDGTPGLWNRVFSVLSDNIRAAAENTASIATTVTVSSGNTLSVLTDLDVSRHIKTDLLSVGSTPTSTVTQAHVIIAAHSGGSDYIQFHDSSAARSNYLLGSHAGGTADGLNLYDLSGDTMIVSFSKQSIRFYQNVVGPVFDLGGALTGTYNAATYGTGSDSKESRIQAAISAATTDNVPRVYIPSSMLSYRARLVSFSTRVQMVREGGNWDVCDVLAYGADPSLTTSSVSAIQEAMRSAQSQGRVCYIPAGNYIVDSGLVFYDSLMMRGAGMGSGNVPITQLYQASAATSILRPLDPASQTQNFVIEDMALSSFGNTANMGVVDCVNCLQFVFRRVMFSGGSQFNLRVVGGATGGDAGFGTIDSCEFQSHQAGSNAILLQASANDQPDGITVANCYFAGTPSTSAFTWIGSIATVGFGAGTLTIVGSRFESGVSFMSIISGRLSNAKFIGNRFETTASNATFGITLRPASVGNAQVCAAFLGNTYASASGLSFIDEGYHKSIRWAEDEAASVMRNEVHDGFAINPAYSFRSESSLGFFHSGTSAIGLSYGQFQVPAGSAIQPPLAFSSESSLGWYRSGASSMALSYGSFRMPADSEMLFVPTSGGPMRLWTPGGLAYFSVNRKPVTFGQDNTALASWLLQINTNAGSGDAILWSHTSAAGASNTRWSLSSAGQQAVGEGVATNPSYQFVSEASLGWYRSGVSTMALSYGTLNVNQARTVSMRTLAASAITVSAANTNVAVNEVVFTVGGASGASLAIHSGGTVYIFDSVSSAKAT